MGTLSNTPMPDNGDPGDETDVNQEIESLEARVSAIEQKLGIQSPADSDDSGGPMGGSMKPSGLPKMPKGKAPFFGSY